MQSLDAALCEQISTFLATILIIVPVMALYFVQTSSARLTLIVVFTVTFAFIMSTMTGAKRSEVFAATAAFVAVQVVYVVRRTVWKLRVKTPKFLYTSAPLHS